MIFRKKFSLSVVLLGIITLVLCPALLAQEEPLSYDDILKMEYLHKFVLSPDESKIIYLVTEGDDLTPPADNATLRMILTKSKTETILSSPDESVTSWSVSPDSRHLAYSALPRTGGDSYLAILDLTTMKVEKMPGVPKELLNGFSWAGTSGLAYLGPSPDTPEDTKPGGVMIMDKEPDPVILNSYDIKTGEITNLTTNTDVIYAYLPSPNGKYILYKSSEYPEVWLTNPEFTYYLLDVENGTEDEIMTREEGYQDENEFAWAPDSSVVYIERMINGGMHYPVRYASDIITYSPATGTVEEIPMQWDRLMLKDLFNDDIEMTPFMGGVYALLADGTNPQLVKYTKTPSGWNMVLLKGEHQGNIFALESTVDGNTLYYNYNSASVPPQIYKAHISGDSIGTPENMTHLNAKLLEKPLGSSEVIEWKGAGGDTIQGVVRYPPGYTKGTLYPLVVVIHGGPIYTDFDSWRDTWEFPYHLITSAGFVALSPNYHGSSNFGFDFAASIEEGHTYSLAVEDMMNGVAVLADKGVIDKNRVGVTGWSYGGILTLSWVTKDNSLKAGVVGAGYQDENSQLAYTNGIVMNRMYYDKTPFEDPEPYIRNMGVYNAGNVTAPILMLQGTVDNAVVPASAMTTYRAYKMASKGDVQMILFKDEPHHMKHYDNQVRKVTEEIEWLSGHLLS